MVLFLLPKAIAAPLYSNLITPLVDFLQYGINSYIPTPYFGKICYIVNLQKCGTAFMCLYLMSVFDTFDHLPSWIYLSLHGTYGMLWCLKELIFPDPSWQRPATLLDHVVAFVGILGPYWYMSYSINSNRTTCSMPVIALCVSVHTLGCVLMMASDSQKYFVLKAKKGLIEDGWFGYCRNTNYLGEMMIYGSYAAMAQDKIAWGILIYAWTLMFGRNIMGKEERFPLKRGGDVYVESSGMLFPDLWAWANGKGNVKRKR
ncbi:hypothetical protein TrCOL_g8993 [Triparma columacea]|uniref:Steroid 5-alpha reductase C-terminal domain-containing protein n=1 Tax=Triparma columacea TaxID=722753 RepID=A0A9W7GQI4_9STRA|nr:hypothetical protein TrCOL_g8993 [Triparma columacea]